MNKYLVSLAGIVLVAPQIALASWWNPFSWSIFHKKEVPVTHEQSTVATTTTTGTASEIEKLQKRIDDLKKQQPATTSVVVKKKMEKIVPTISHPKSTQPDASLQLETPTATPATTVPVVFDVCKNIEGVQTLAPAGMYADNGNCLPIINTQPQQIQTQQSMQNQTNTNAIQIQALTREYNSQVAAINQQIINIKNQYYIDYENIAKQGITMESVAGQQQKLLSNANTKIDQLNLQIQQLYLNYTNSINQLQ